MLKPHNPRLFDTLENGRVYQTVLLQGHCLRGNCRLGFGGRKPRGDGLAPEKLGTEYKKGSGIRYARLGAPSRLGDYATSNLLGGFFARRILYAMQLETEALFADQPPAQDLEAHLELVATELGGFSSLHAYSQAPQPSDHVLPVLKTGEDVFYTF